jgi:hypothetical protein
VAARQDETLSKNVSTASTICGIAHNMSWNVKLDLYSANKAEDDARRHFGTMCLAASRGLGVLIIER